MLIRDRLLHKRPVFSFEFFPPKQEKGERVLWRSLEQLAPLEPDFVSVTYGAGDSTRSRTIELVGRIKHELGIEPMAHLTCVGATKDELAATVDRLLALDVRNILALRGDPPQGHANFEPTPGGFTHASELIAWLRERWPFPSSSLSSSSSCSSRAAFSSNWVVNRLMPYRWSRPSRAAT